MASRQGARGRGSQGVRRTRCRASGRGYLDEPETKTKWSTLFSKAYVGRTIFCAVFWVCIVIPYFALTFFQSDVLGALGLENPVVVALLGTFVALLGAVLGWYLIDKVGRRPLLIGPMFICGIALTTVAIGATVGLPVVVNVIAFFGYLFFYGIMGILCGVYPLEVFPTSVRTSVWGSPPASPALALQSRRSSCRSVSRRWVSFRCC